MGVQEGPTVWPRKPRRCSFTALCRSPALPNDPPEAWYLPLSLKTALHYSANRTSTHMQRKDWCINISYHLSPTIKSVTYNLWFTVITAVVVISHGNTVGLGAELLMGGLHSSFIVD